MPKVKRFRNPLKSSHGPYDAPGHSLSSTTPAPSLVIEPSISLQAPPHAPASSSVADEVPQQGQAPTQPSNPSAMSTHHLGHSNNTTKHIKIKVNEVNNLPIGDRIIVDFDIYDAAYGEAQGLLAGYCGLLAIDGNFFPINFDRWSGPSGLLMPLHTDIAMKVVEEIKKFDAGGSKANSRRRHELFLETGEYPTWGKIIIETHKRNDGLFVNNEARTLVEQIELTQGNANESEISPDDIIGKVLGAEHSGRSQLVDTLTALKAYMISKEGRVPQQFISLFAPQPQPSDDAESEPTSPVDVRGSSGSSYQNQQANT
ncbi:uncharacterized protein [Nicotiana tomentosiformis]|uniref:uncharacterized protein n=1 Tax=Nicotiana tomentosiformis TaxID=4098 RepID=UPI00388CC959